VYALTDYREVDRSIALAPPPSRFRDGRARAVLASVLASSEKREAD
jgi:hypothetical protein